MTVAVAELIDRGVKAYLAGRETDALEAFRQVLALEPENAKARWYLEKLGAAARAPGAPPVAERRVQLDLAAELHGYFDPAPRRRRRGRRPPRARRRRRRRSRGGTARPAPCRARRRSTRRACPRSRRTTRRRRGTRGPPPRATIVLEATRRARPRRRLGEVRPPPARAGGRPADASPARSDVEVWLSAAKELFALGDFSGSLELIEKILQVDPDHGEAREYLRQNEATLVAMYESKLGPLSGVPRLAIKPEEVLWLNLDHRAGFLLAQIDGTVDYDSLFALSGLPRLDTARILANLIADGVIAS